MPKQAGLGRLQLLRWLNDLLETDYTKVEHLADGPSPSYIYINPDSLSMDKHKHTLTHPTIARKYNVA